MTVMDTLESLHQGIVRCTACPLWRSRTHAVPGEGPCPAPAMLVGEAPGKEEDASGRPFRGRSGQVLTELFTEAGIRRETFFITSSVKCRPPRNRMPRPCELLTCRERWLLRQITILNPTLVVCLGGVSARSLLGIDRLEPVHGKVLEAQGRQFFVTYHPSSAMRFPRIRTAMRDDLRVLRRLLARL